MNRDEYVEREVKATHDKIAALSRECLQIRKENRSEFNAALLYRPDYVAQEIEYLLAGHIGGIGAYTIAQAILAEPGMNRVARLSQLIAALEWECPAREARKAYLVLSVEQQETIDAAIEKVIADATEGEER